MRTAKFDLINLHCNPQELGREKRAEEELDLREFKRRKRCREDGREMKSCVVMFSGELASNKTWRKLKAKTQLCHVEPGYVSYF